MMNDTSTAPGWSRRLLRRDVMSGGLIAVFGVAYTIQATNIGEGASHALVPPWGFPLFVGIALISIGAMLCLTGMSRVQETSPNTDGDGIHWPSALSGMAILIAYVVILVPVGFVLSTIVMIVSMARVFGSRSLGRDALYATLFAIVAYSIFNYGIGVPLPSGLFTGLF